MEPKQQTEQLGTEKISTLLRNLSVPCVNWHVCHDFI